MSVFKFRKIQHRVFFYIALTLTLLITGILLVQLLYLDDWYRDRKMAQLEADVLSFSSTLEGYSGNEQFLYLLVDQFQETNGVNLDIYHEDGYDFLYREEEEDDIYDGRYLIVRGEEEEYFFVYLDDYPELADELIDTFQIGTVFYTVAYRDLEALFLLTINETYIGLDEIDEEDEAMLTNPDNRFERHEEIFGEDEEIFFGDLTVVDLVEDDFDAYNDAYDEYDRYRFRVIDEGFSSFVVEQPFTNIQTLVYQKEMIIQGEPVKLYVEASLQSAEEVMAFATPFFVMFYVVGFILVIFLARGLAISITKPIIAMKDMAERMSELDFSNKISVGSQDELGQLAVSINQMSDSLEESMDALKIANYKLLQDIEKERQQEAVRKEFVANVSHELKTPLGIARGYIEAVLDGIRKERQEDYLKITLKELDRMNQIVLNMLDMMKMEDGKVPVTFADKDIRPILKGMEEYFEVLLNTKAMSLSIDESIDHAVIEETTFKSLMLNLLSNAIHYGVTGTEVKVKGRAMEGELKMWVENKVDEPDSIDLDKIWHKFYTVDQSHNRKTSGTGLGMSIVRNILDQYGAKYNVFVHDDSFVFEFTLKRE